MAGRIMNYPHLIRPEAMMGRFVHNLALAAVFVHTLCGCCWHHGHADGPRNQHASADHAAAGHQQEHGPCGCPEQDHRSPSERQSCGGVTCDFVRTESGGFQPWLIEIGSSALALHAPTADSARPVHAATTLAIEPQGRRHLLLQRLLI